MSESALYACQRAVVAALKTPGASWGQHVRLNNGMAGWDYPYVVFTFSGGREINRIRASGGDAEIVLLIKAISDVFETAARCNDEIAGLLNDRGTQDNRPGTVAALNAGASWTILTSTREDYISYEERISDTSAIYHEGARYRFIMEAI